MPDTEHQRRFALSMGDSLPARYYTLQAGKKIIIVALSKNKLFLQEHEQEWFFEAGNR
jgi:hypothetical protein